MLEKVIKMPREKIVVPLKPESFLDFRERGKEYVLKRYGRNFNEKNVYPNKRVLLRNAYSGREELRGRIGRVVIGELESIFREIDYRLVTPRAKTMSEAISSIKTIPEDKSVYIAFQVSINQK